MSDGDPDQVADRLDVPIERGFASAQLPPGLISTLLDAAHDAIWMRDCDGIFRVANPAACRIMGGSPDEIVGRSIFDVWGPEVGARLAAETERILSAGRGITVEETMFDAGRGAAAIFLSNKVPVYADDGTPLGILGISRDITDRKRSEDELRASGARLAQQVAELRAVYDSAPLGMALFDRELRYLRVNPELAAINGAPAEAHIGRTLHEVLPDQASLIEPLIEQVFATGVAARNLEATTSDPERHWLAGFYPIEGEDGAVALVGAWVLEITDRKTAEQRERMLAREVDHRAKNLLAVVQSIVQLTPADDAEELKASVVGRIQALARAHSLLSDSRWDGVDFGQLVAEELAPFAADEQRRVHYSGPAITLRPAAAQSLALVLHELATNAAKYGSLSNAVGEVRVDWRRIDGEAGPVLDVQWTESGGPPVSQPDELGFGSQIIRASVERQLRGKVRKHWLEAGLVCSLQVPAAEILRRPE